MVIRDGPPFHVYNKGWATLGLPRNYTGPTPSFKDRPYTPTGVYHPIPKTSTSACHVSCCLLVTSHIFNTAKSDVVRSYLGYCAGSHQTSEAKRLWARIVLEWVTFREVLVTNPHFAPFPILFKLALATFHFHLFKLPMTKCLLGFYFSISATSAKHSKQKNE